MALSLVRLVEDTLTLETMRTGTLTVTIVTQQDSETALVLVGLP